MSRLYQKDIEPCSLQPRMQPLRQWPRLKSDPLHLKTKRRKESNQSFGFTRDVRLPDNLALRVHDARARPRKAVCANRTVSNHTQ